MHLTEETATLSKEVADLESSRAEATTLRKAEKAAMATGLLQMDRPRMGTDEWKSLANPNFQGGDKGLKTGSGWGHTEGMQTFGKKYTGQQDEAGGVMAMLEVIASDFANLEADTKAAEAAGQESYDEFMVESKRNIAMKEKKIEMNTADKAAAKSKLEEDTKDLKGTQDELLAADRYHAKLVPQCIDKGMTFEERTKARESEIASLKQALKILG